MLNISKPVGTSECERGFSQVNLIETDIRSRLLVTTIADLLFVNLDGPPLKLWQPKTHVLRWLRTLLKKSSLKIKFSILVALFWIPSTYLMSQCATKVSLATRHLPCPDRLELFNITKERRISRQVTYETRIDKLDCTTNNPWWYVRELVRYCKERYHLIKG